MVVVGVDVQLWTSGLAFLNPKVASRPEHQHLMGDPGCFTQSDRSFPCGTKNGQGARYHTWSTPPWRQKPIEAQTPWAAVSCLACAAQAAPWRTRSPRASSRHSSRTGWTVCSQEALWTGSRRAAVSHNTNHNTRPLLIVLDTENANKVGRRPRQGLCACPPAYADLPRAIFYISSGVGNDLGDDLSTEGRAQKLKSLLVCLHANPRPCLSNNDTAPFCDRWSRALCVTGATRSPRGTTAAKQGVSRAQQQSKTHRRHRVQRTNHHTED